MTSARVFKSGNSQAIRIPKEFRFDDGEEVVIRRFGSGIVVLPRKLSAKRLMAMFKEVGPVQLERDQPGWTDRR